MTVTAGSNKVILQGDGATGPPGSPFSLGTSFIGVGAQYISVIYTDAAGNETVLTPLQFTLALTPGQPPNWGRGGTVAYPLSGPAIAVGTSLTVVRTLPLAQAITLQNQASYGQYASAAETALDLETLLLQQIATTFSRALVAPPTDPDTNLVIPNAVQRALQLLGFDGSGLPIAAQPSSALVSTAMQPVVAAATLAAARTEMGIDTSSVLFIGDVHDYYLLGPAPALWLLLEGQQPNRTDFPELFGALAPAMACVVTNTLNSVTGLAFDTAGWAAGWAVEGAGIPAATTISSIDGANAISLSNPATADGASIRVFPYGPGDGLDTFDLPAVAGRVTAALDIANATLTGGNKIGAVLGEQTHTLLATEMPVHTHTPTPAAHQHGNPDFTGQSSGVFGFGASTPQTIPIGARAIPAATQTVAIANAGSGGAHNNVQPTFVTRKIIYAGR